MEIVKDLVSVIVPCYNMSNRIHRLFDSLLTQTYKKLQIILVNDGSTDNSEEIVLEYKKKFEIQGIDFQYILQTNTGLGGAINKGLKYIKGEFFIWPDADDWLASDSVEIRVKFLKENLDYGFVRSDAYLFFESDLKHPIGLLTDKNPEKSKIQDLLLNYIWEKNANYCPGCHMIRTALFQSVCKNMDIYSARGGQNFQLLAPMLCNYKFGYIDKPLYNYVIYKRSMSHGDNTFDEYIRRTRRGEDIKVQTLRILPLPENVKRDYINQVHQKCNISRAQISYDFGNKKAFDYHYNTIDNQYIPVELNKIYKSSFLTSPLWLLLHKLFSKSLRKLKSSNISYYLRAKRFQIKKFLRW